MLPPTPEGAFRAVPKTGVIYVMTEAAKAGYRPTSEGWANLGQGAPETGPLPGAPDRIHTVHISNDDHEYAPVDGLVELKEAVARLYNERYRVGRTSQYTKDNVAISPGGRAALTRIVTTLGRANIGHFLPDYTAYEELLGSFGTFVPIPITLQAERGYSFSANELRDEILGRGLSAALLSNPGNPTGRLLHGDDLRAWVDVARTYNTTLILDEFYSHYTYVGDRLTVSAAEMVEDVDHDPIAIVDGLTKNWRYPGWRVCWTVGPRALIEKVASAGSFLDGGCARPMQRAAIPLVERDLADTEARAIQASFRSKRELLLNGLKRLGVRVPAEPQGGFYVWGDLSGLPEGANTGMGLFRRALDEGVILVPGEFFDINPGRRRPDRPGRFQNYARFSFGPSEEVLERGLVGLARAIQRA